MLYPSCFVKQPEQLLENYPQQILVTKADEAWPPLADAFLEEWLRELPKEAPGLWTIQKGKTLCYAWRLAGDSETVRASAPTLEIGAEPILVVGIQDLDLSPCLEGLLLKNYSYLRQHALQLEVVSPMPQAVVETEALCQSVWLARDWGNDPYNRLHAAEVHVRLEALAAAHGLSYEGLGPVALKSLNMQGLLSVNQGSKNPPLFAVLEYAPLGMEKEAPLVLVGKGILFDTGGSSLKNSKGMEDMKADMCGGANVVATLVWAAKTKQALRLIGLVPFTDNRLAPDSLVPGDVIRYSNGTTVEVLNTDAEGRLVLADALLYAKKFEPALVIDQATLTGSAVGTFGTEAMAGMQDQAEEHLKRLQASGKRVGEYVVELPMLEAYREGMKSQVADVKNIAGPYAGCITAGMFLQMFTDYPWIHLDLANSFRSGARGYLPIGATGAGVRLMADFITQWQTHDKASN